MRGEEGGTSGRRWAGRGSSGPPILGSEEGDREERALGSSFRTTGAHIALGGLS